MIPLKGYQKYGKLTLNHVGSDGDTLVKNGIIAFVAHESTISKQLKMANLKRNINQNLITCIDMGLKQVKLEYNSLRY